MIRPDTKPVLAAVASLTRGGRFGITPTQSELYFGQTSARRDSKSQTGGKPTNRLPDEEIRVDTVAPI